jgi:predicted amidohydrolase
VGAHQHIALLAEEMEDILERIVKLATVELGEARVEELMASMVKVTKIDGFVIAPGLVDTMLGHVYVDAKISTTDPRTTLNMEVVKSCGKYSYVATSASVSDFNVVSTKKRGGGGRDTKNQSNRY